MAREQERESISWQERLALIVGSEDKFEVLSNGVTIKIERLAPKESFSDWYIRILRPGEDVEVEEYELREGRGLTSMKLSYRSPIKNIAGVDLSGVCNLADVDEKGVLEVWDVAEPEVLPEHLNEFHEGVTKVVQFVEDTIAAAK